MTRLSSSLSTACGALALSVALGCTAQVGGIPHPVGSGNNPGTGSGPGAGTGNRPGTPGVSGSGNSIGATGSVIGTGNVGPGSGGTGGTSITPGTDPGTGPVVVADANAAGLRPVRLLTRREYLNTVKDLLSDTSIVPDGLPSEDEDPTAESPFHLTGDVATLDVTLYRDAAEALAKSAVTRMNTLLPCAATATTANDGGCFNTFLTTLGMKMYRRPLADVDKTRLTDMYNTAKAAAPTGLGLTFSGAIGFVIETVLQSPEFLYHWYVDPTLKLNSVMEGTGQIKLGNYEVANRLSYFLWGTMPNQALFDAAAAGKLSDAAGIEAQARLMLTDAKASAMFSDFFVDWLDMDVLSTKPKDAAVYSMYNDTLTAAMTSELQSFSTAIMSGTGHFEELMTGTNSFANQPLAALYKIPGGVTGMAMKPVMLPAAERSGLLTMAGFLSLTGASDGSNPPRRGKAVFYKFLCGVLPPTPAVVPDPKPITPGVTTRQRFEEHSMNPCTGACHKILDPLGFAFENYDGIGQYRTTDNNQPVNAATMLTLDGKTQPIADARALAGVLATSDQAQTCFAKQWFRYALGRVDTVADLASVNGAATTFKTASRDVRELIVGVSTSRTFRYRAPGTGEVLQ